MLPQLGPLNDRQKAILEEASKGCGRLSALVDEISEIAKLEDGTVTMMREEVSLDPLVDDAIESVQEGRDRGVLAVRQSPGPLPPVSGDRRRLTDIVRVLLRSVLREQSEPVTVTIRTETRTVNGAAMAALAIGAGGAVEDVLSMDLSTARLNESRGGLGLAVPIARRVIECLGGRVWSLHDGRVIGAIALLLPIKENRS
jgi:K+-sensing histidine kinase KdpD